MKYCRTINSSYTKNNINYPNNMNNLNKEDIIYLIKENWTNFTWCNIEDFNSGITFVIDSKNPKLVNTKKIKEEVQIVNFKNWWTIINVSDEIFPEISEIIQKFWIDEDKIWALLKSKYKWTLSPYHKMQLYLFSDEKLTPIDSNIRKLEKSEKSLFDNFRAKCSEEDNYQVYMDFDVDFHHFYAYFYKNEIVALWDFCKIYDEDKVALPSIITKEDCRWKWYGKAVVNALTHEIIKLWLVARYPVDPKNIGSITIAKSLWYEDIINSCSLSMR